MKSSTAVILTTAIFAAVAVCFSQPAAAAIFFVGGVLLWQRHTLEVKINKLLVDRGISVSQEELSR